MTERKEKFTPGPWVLDRDTLFVESVAEDKEGASFEPVCEVWGSINEPNFGDGYLIAAAPEMYATLDELTSDVRHLRQSGSTGQLKVILDKIEKVLKKARGEE